MLLKIANPEIELAHRLAIEIIPRGYATYANCYSPLADLHGLLTLACRANWSGLFQPPSQLLF